MLLFFFSASASDNELSCAQCRVAECFDETLRPFFIFVFSKFRQGVWC
jgi:hypothetical protein